MSIILFITTLSERNAITELKLRLENCKSKTSINKFIGLGFSQFKFSRFHIILSNNIINVGIDNNKR